MGRGAKNAPPHVASQQQLSEKTNMRLWIILQAARKFRLF
jgi:hypothetical protein